MTQQAALVGERTPRTEGREKVTGNAEYAIDVLPEGTLWCRFLRSPYPHAKVRRIDVERARSLPGVHAILTGEDVRGLRAGNMFVDEPLLSSWDRLRFIGDRVAAVAAVDADTADRALALIEVDYEELPPVLSPRESMEAGAPILHPDFNTYRGVEHLESPSNAYGETLHAWGDLDRGFADADVIVERTYTTPRMHQAYLEPHSSVVFVDEDGSVQIWVSTQAPTARRVHLARLMNLPREDVVIHFTHVGGAFGGKFDTSAAAVCYFLAKQTGRPVKYVMDYSEELSAMNPRHASEIRIRAGVKRDGTLTAWEAEGFFPTGAYAAYAPVPALGGLLGSTMVNSYRIPNVRITGHQVYTNTVPGGDFRGPGIVQALFASESHLDVLARELGMDPFDLRLKNFIHSGAEAIGHDVWQPVASPGDAEYQEVRLEFALRTAADRAGYFDPKPPYVGRGIAVHEAVDSGFDTHAAVTIMPDGTIEANMSSFDPGVGTGTMLAQIIAQELGVSVTDVHVVPWDTRGPRDWGVGGQRGARTMTQAASRAANDAKSSLSRLAAEFFGWAEERIEFVGGRVRDGADGASVQLGEIAERAGSPVIGRGDVDEARETPYVSFAVHIAEVAVDPETGQVRLQTYTAVHETGRVVNPMNFEGQIEGGSVQGIGHALTEELRLDQGRVTNPSLADYKIPTMRDVPEFRTVVLESDTGHGPYKVRGIGDMPIVLPSAAIANAIADATGVRVYALPLTAERVYEALRGSGAA
ncbi:MAG: xanthine dehydrogenase family protein molybdopterin-binding subunit [Chloroflexi bacterium]|nr:xanthine dehydrogenase family protein molybdopterin-binding subunit [Chloroflexota bacterium]